MRYFSDDLLRRLRNQISFENLFDRLHWPHKRRGDQLAFPSIPARTPGVTSSSTG
jgi:hypothetical protein